MSLLYPSSLFFFCGAQRLNMTPLFLLKRITQDLHDPYHNLYLISPELTKYFYILFLIMLILAGCIYSFEKILFKKKNFTQFQRILTCIGLINVVFLAGLQQIDRQASLRHEMETYGGKSLEERYEYIFLKIYHNAMETKKHLHHRHQGQLITDWDISQDPGMYMQRALAYHLYPKVSLRFDNGTPQDCIIIFSKKDPLKYIPDDYKIIYTNKKQLLRCHKKG